MVSSYSSSSLALFAVSCFLLLSLPGCVLTAVVTLKSIEIYNTHEVLNTKPTVYFRCEDDNKEKTTLPDVTRLNTTYSFNGDESWQPLTEFASKKCKRCGFYEFDNFKDDDVFEVWEFCPSEFKQSNGIYRRVTKDEFDATFSCPDCASLAGDPKSSPNTHEKGKGAHVALVVLVSLMVSVIVIAGMVAGYKYWQKKKRQQEQARFLKLFEEGDDLEDELGLGSAL